MLSPNFRVREFDVQDINPFSIELAWGPVSKDSNQVKSKFIILVLIIEKFKNK